MGTFFNEPGPPHFFMRAEFCYAANMIRCLCIIALSLSSTFAESITAARVSHLPGPAQAAWNLFLVNSTSNAHKDAEANNFFC
jgi:hypothetical protein